MIPFWALEHLKDKLKILAGWNSSLPTDKNLGGEAASVDSLALIELADKSGDTPMGVGWETL